MLRQVLMFLASCFACSQTLAATVQFNDPEYNGQWYLDTLNFGQAWAQIMELPERGNITVAVIDSGFDTEHIDLQRNLAIDQGINIVNGSDNLSPVNPHGTGTIGLLAATSGNGKGITQTAWTSRAIPIRVSNRSDGAAYTTDMANAIRYAADQGARVINLSYSGVHLGILQRAAKYAQQRGAVVFMAAGNDGRNHRNWRNHKQLIAVGSIDSDITRSSFSSRGKFVDLVAPGRDILSLTTKDRTKSWSGTSFSSPIAAGVAALMFTANPSLAPWQVRKLLVLTAKDLGQPGRDNAYGHGLVDASAAVAAAITARGQYRPKDGGTAIELIDSDLAAYRGISFANQVEPTDLTTYEEGNTAVPEPAAVMLFLMGSCLLASRSVAR